MNYDDVFAKVVDLLQREKRVSYRVLKRRLNLDDDYLEDLKSDLIEAKQLAVDENDRILVWVGNTNSAKAAPVDTPPSPSNAERRQLTVMFCDLVDSTRLSGQLDPEDLRQVIRAYQATVSKVVHRYEGYIAQYLGDGLLVYFGWPMAHEDDAQRAVHAGLEIAASTHALNTDLAANYRVQLAVRLGIHTGLVVVGEMGGEGRRELLALGETPNLAARIQAIAQPNTVVISADTHRLIQGYFALTPWAHTI